MLKKKAKEQKQKEIALEEQIEKAEEDRKLEKKMQNQEKVLAR